MVRIAVGGFQHETNTFSDTLATYEEFVKHDSWPGLTRGAALFDAVAGINIPIEGFIGAARARGHELVPLTWCAAEPSSCVTRDAFERVMAMLLDDLHAAGPLDAVYLDLHGAMVAEHHADGEGEILARVRAAIGPRVALVNSLDLHANITARMVDASDAMTVFRTYPHIDMDTTGARAHALLETLLEGARFAKCFAQAPFLVPLSAQWTDAAPNRQLYRQVTSACAGSVTNLELALGFPAADIHDCGPAAVAYDTEAARARAALDALMRSFEDAEGEFVNELLSPDEAVRLAMAQRQGPVVLADAQDNPGAGGSSDTVALLEALVRAHARGAALAFINDPQAAAHAHEAGVGATIDTALGGKSAQPGQTPYRGRFHVERLGDGVFDCTGQMYRGTRTNLGPTAVLRVAGEDCEVRVVVSSTRFQNLDQACFRHIGIEPRAQKILVVKSTVHFRADYDPIASRTLIVEAPGAHPCRLTGVDYRHLRDGVRLEPGGPPHRGIRATPAPSP